MLSLVFNLVYCSLFFYINMNVGSVMYMYYVTMATAFQDILSRGRVPLVVGGTGLYVRTLLQGPSGSPSSTPASRERIEEMVKEDGYDWEKR